MKTKLTIPDPMKDYTVKEGLIFFDAGERVSLQDLQKIFTMPAIAELILNKKVERDCNVIAPNKKEKMIWGEQKKASDDLLEWVDVEFIQKYGDKYQCRILSNHFITHFKYIK